MSSSVVLAIALGGALGANLRFHLDRLSKKFERTARWPWGTLLANALASFGLGAFTQAQLSSFWMALLGVGLCGALSTYSTFAVEAVALARAEDRYAWRLSASYILTTVLVTLLSAWLGRALIG